MKVEAFYKEIGGDYQMAKATFRTDERIRHYLDMYVQDEYYEKLCRAREEQDVKAAFEAVHALKGITGMLYLTGLYEAVVLLVEQLRPQNAPMDEALFERVKNEQETVLEKMAEIEM